MIQRSSCQKKKLKKSKIFVVNNFTGTILRGNDHSTKGKVSLINIYSKNLYLPSQGLLYRCSGAGMWKTLGEPVVIGGDNLPSLVRIGLTDLKNIGRASGPPATVCWIEVKVAVLCAHQYMPWNLLQWCRNRGGQGGHWPPQYLADQITLFEPGRADYPHLLLLPPPMFFTIRHHWS